MNYTKLQRRTLISGDYNQSTAETKVQYRLNECFKELRLERWRMENTIDSKLPPFIYETLLETQL